MLFDWSLEGFKLISTCVLIKYTNNNTPNNNPHPTPLHRSQKNLENSQMCFNLNSQTCFTNVNGDKCMHYSAYCIQYSLGASGFEIEVICPCILMISLADLSFSLRIIILLSILIVQSTLQNMFI